MPIFQAPFRIMKRVPRRTLSPLVDPAVWERLLALSQELPVLTQTVCFECGVSPEAKRTDFAFNLFSGWDTTDFVKYCDRAASEAPIWQRVARFFEAWGEPSRDLCWRIPFVCVAFDLQPEVSGLPAPCLSLCIDPNFFERRIGAPLHASTTPSELVALADECTQLLRKQPLAKSASERLLACVRGDPALEVRHLSFMLSRSASPVKLDVRLPVVKLAHFLTSIAWKGPAHDLEQQVRAWAPHESHVQLNLQIATDMASPLEVELLCDTRGSAVQRRADLLETLVRRGLADASKVEVLRRISERPCLVDDAVAPVLAMSWYIKLRFTGSQATDAKAYLGVMPRWFRESAHTAAV